MTECSKIGVMLSAFGDGELGPRARRKVESHLALCTTCIASLSDYSTLSNEIRKIVEIPRLEGFSRSVLERIGKLVVIAFLILAARGGTARLAPSSSVSVRVDSVYAISKPGYSFGVVSHRAQRTGKGDAVAFNLPGGAMLRVRARAIDDGMIAMHVVLFEGRRQTMNTEMNIKAGSTFYFSGEPSREGTLMLRISPTTPGVISADASPGPRLAG
jgi:hypothetical protein